MTENVVRVVYSVKNIIFICLLDSFFILMDVFFIFTQPVSVSSVAMIALFTYCVFSLIYLALNRIKMISVINGKILIERFLLRDLTFEQNKIKFISKDGVRFGKKGFNLKFVINKSEVIIVLLKAMEIKNTEEGLNGIINGAHLYINKEDINMLHKRANLTVVVLTIFIILLFIINAIINHWGLIFIICTIILVGFYFLEDMIFGKSIESIESKFMKFILNGIVKLVAIILTVALGIAIYKIFEFWNIDLLKVTM